MRSSFANEIIAACGSREDIFILSGDAGLGVFDRFREDFPQRFLNTGAAEQNAVSFAAGLALSGSKVFIYNLIPFLFYRCYEQIRNDICYQELPVVLVGIGSGITYAPQGMSHYSVEDLGLSQTLPNLVTISPSDPAEARMAARYALECDRPLYVRLAKSGEQLLHRDDSFDIRVPHLVREGGSVALVFHGSISAEVLAAYEILKAQGCPPRLVSVPTVQPLAGPELIALLDGVGHVVCVEEHFSNCGLGRMLVCLKSETGAGWGVEVLGIPPHYIHAVHNTAGLRSLYGLDAGSIVRTVKSVQER